MPNRLNDNEGDKAIIGETTPVRVGFIIVILGLFLGAFGSSMWWASSISSKLDSILSSQRTTDSTIIELKAKDLALDKDLNDVKLKMALSDVEVKAVKDKIASVLPK